MVAPASLIILPFLLVRNVPAGIYDVFNPVLATQYAGLSTTQYTNITSASGLFAGIMGLLFGGFLTAKIGKRRMLAIMFSLTGVLVLAVGLIPTSWSDPMVLYALVWGLDFLGIFVAIAMIPLAMQVCTPAVAATQFTIYMALANFGRPIGAWIVASANSIEPQLVFFAIGPIMLLAAVATIFLKRGEASAEVEKATAHGAGAGPADS
jgi:PAT family beta-lactamase induction signal transducer AmpG